MLQYTVCAFLAPALVSAVAFPAAFPWAAPEPTLVIPAEDNWSPAPTRAPDVGALELFRRDAGDNTCGYISGVSSRSLTCNNVNYVCATNTFYGVHGCCDPNGISTCSIPTTCIPSSLMSASCTGDCSTNDYIAKCTDSEQPYCYEWRYVYSTRTVMTEHGCAASAFTVSVERTFDDEGTTSSLASEVQISYVTVTPSAASTSASSTAASGSVASQTAGPSETPTTSETKKKKTNVGAIVGGVVGGLVVIGALAFGIIFLILRKRKQNQNNAAGGVNQPMMGGPGGPTGPAGVTEYKPQPAGNAYPSPNPQFADPSNAGYYGQEQKPQSFAHMGVPGQEMNHPYSPPMSPAPQYSGPAPVQPVPFGIAEAGGSPVQQQPGQHPQSSPQPSPGAAPVAPHQQQQQHQIYEAPA